MHNIHWLKHDPYLDNSRLQKSGWKSVITCPWPLSFLSKRGSNCLWSYIGSKMGMLYWRCDWTVDWHRLFGRVWEGLISLSLPLTEPLISELHVCRTRETLPPKPPPPTHPLTHPLQGITEASTEEVAMERFIFLPSLRKGEKKKNLYT